MSSLHFRWSLPRSQYHNLRTMGSPISVIGRSFHSHFSKHGEIDYMSVDLAPDEPGICHGTAKIDFVSFVTASKASARLQRPPRATPATTTTPTPTTPAAVSDILLLSACFRAGRRS